MTLDELKSIERAAESARSNKESLARAAKALADTRKSEVTHSTCDLIHNVMKYWNYGSDDVAKGEFYKVLDEFQADILRIAEMRLEARARASGQHERMLRAQIAGFLGEESALAARERT